MAFEKGGKIQTLVSGVTIPWDLGLGANAQVTLTMDGTLANPTHMVPGIDYAVKVTQDATGGWTLAFGTRYKFDGGVAPVVSAGAGVVDLLTFWSDGANMVLLDHIVDVS